LIGRRHKGVFTLAERKSLFTVLGRSDRKTAPEVRREIRELLEPFRDLVYVLTLDNGKEFTEHQELAREHETEVCFAHPRSSWERGLNENTNGLVRQHFPKSVNFTSARKDDINRVMNRLNRRPRKKLGFKTPYEVFYHTSAMLTPQVAL